MTKGALAAREQGNYWEMASLLYEKQPKNIEAMLELADSLNFDKDKFIDRFNSKEVENEIQTEIKSADLLEIDATPTMFINGEKIVGVKPYYEFKEILVRHGAKRK
jgi:protein-disulfide isomerase